LAGIECGGKGYKEIGRERKWWGGIESGGFG